MAAGSLTASSSLRIAEASLGRALTAILMAGASIALAAFAVVLTFAGGESRWWVLACLAVVVPAAAGLFVVLYRPGNVVAWLLLFDAINVGAAFVVAPYARYALLVNPGSLPGARWALALDNANWPILFASPVALLFAFPDGRLPGPRWRRVVVASAVCWTVVQLGALFHPDPGSGPLSRIASPLPRMPEWLHLVELPFFLGAAASLVLAAWSVRVRLRNADGIGRLQLLWLAYGGLLLPITIVACFVDDALTGQVGDAVGVALVLALTVVPAAIAVAIFGYGLFDIELVLSRTLVYAVLTAAVVGGYLLVFFALDGVVRLQGVAGVAAAGAVALGFQPLRIVVQQRVERLVYGDRSDPYTALVRLGRRLRSAPDTSNVLATIVEGVSASLRLRYCAVELGGSLVAERGTPAADHASVPLTYQGEELGSLIVAPPPRSDTSRLLDDLATQAGAAVHGVRLMADLQRSRERLVTAREEERLRLRRDLHDGLGPTLAALVFKIDLIRDGARLDPDGTSRKLRELGAQTQSAIADIRRLVYALRPPALDELGLLDALREQAASLSDGSGVAVSVEGEAVHELPAAVEVAAYRIVVEAMTNAVRHAQASSCTVSLRQGRRLTVTVTDDGDGVSDAPRAGIGLASMRERAAELGGTLRVERRADGGTVVEATLPIAP